VDATGSGSCVVAGFGTGGVESLGSATTVSVRWILVRQVVRMGVDGTGSGSCPMGGFVIRRSASS